MNRTDKIRLIEPEHRYELENEPEIEFTSCTTFINKFFESFDKEAIANKLVSSHPSYIDMAAEDLIAQWDQTAVDGTEVHNEIDAYIKENKPPTLPKSILAVEYLDSRTKDNIELTSEVIIYSKEMKLAGTIDLLVYNKDKDLYKIIDWKTSKKIEMSSFGNKTGTHAVTEHLMDCNFTHYSLQLSLYRYILEREYGLKVHNCELCHLSDSVKDIRCEYHKDTIEAMLIAEGRIGN